MSQGYYYNLNPLNPRVEVWLPLLREADAYLGFVAQPVQMGQVALTDKAVH